MFQATGFGCAGPVWVMLYLAASPLLRISSKEDVRQADMASPTAILAIPGALVLCYLGPAILMSLRSPEVVSNSFQQSAIVLWNTCPLWIAAIHTLLEALIKSYMPRSNLDQVQSGQHMTALRIVNTIAIVISFVGHASCISLAVANSVFPSIFAPEYQGAFTLYELFVPPIAWSQVKTVGDGVRGFFLWDQMAGYAAILILVFAQLERVAHIQGRQYKWLGCALAGTGSLLVLGPGATCLLTSWIRAELLHEDAERGEYGQLMHKVLK